MIGTFLSNLRASLAPKRVTSVLKGPAWVLFVTGFVSNVTSIFVSLFTLLVYDKVYPHNGFNTLVVLTIGVLALLVIDVSLKSYRAGAINYALYGGNAMTDLDTLRSQFVINGLARVSGKTNAYLKASIEKLQDIRPSDVRTAVLVVDLPFTVLLLLVIYFIGGLLVWIPVIAILFLILYIGATHRAHGEANRELERRKQRAIENYAFFARGSEWLMGLGAWQWLSSREKVGREAILESSAEVGLLANRRQLVHQTTLQALSIAVVFFGFFFYQQGDISFGGIIAVYLLSNRALNPVGNIAQVISTEDPVPEVDENEVASHKSTISMPAAGNEWVISLTDLSFTYPNTDEPALEIEKLNIGSGERIAILGRSGSGKSTFAKILCRLVEGYKGDVRWNDLPIGTLDAQDWSHFCTYIPQTPWLGQGSLIDQIKLGRDDLSDAEVAQSIGKVGLTKLFTTGKETTTGDAFSAGQLQMIGLLRSLVRKSPLIILDEPTNFLDEESEAKVMEAIFEHYSDATIIVITHRHSLLRHMKRALVFENGKLTKDGVIQEVKR